MAESKCPVGREVLSSILWDTLIPQQGVRLGCREKGSIHQACQSLWCETLVQLMTNQSPCRCRDRDKCSDFPVHSSCRGLVWLETLLTGRICPDASSSQSSPFPSRLIISSSTHCDAALKDVLAPLPQPCRSPVLLCIYMLLSSAMDHLLSPAINRIHFTAGTKAGCLPGPDTSLLLIEAGMRLSLILEMQKSQMFPRPGRISLPGPALYQS